MATVVNVKPNDPFAGFGDAFSKAMQSKQNIQAQKDLQSQAHANALEKMQASIDIQNNARRAEEAETRQLMDRANEQETETYQVIPDLFQTPAQLQQKNNAAADINLRAEERRKEASQTLRMRGFTKQGGKFVKLEHAKKESSILLDRARIRQMDKEWDAKLKSWQGTKNVSVAIKQGLLRNTKFLQSISNEDGTVNHTMLDAVSDAVASDPQYKSMIKPLLMDGTTPFFVSSNFNMSIRTFQENMDLGYVQTTPSPAHIPFTDMKAFRAMVKNVPANRMKKYNTQKSFLNGITKNAEYTNRIMSHPILRDITEPYVRGMTPESIDKAAKSVFATSPDGILVLDKLPVHDKQVISGLFGSTLSNIITGIVKVTGREDVEDNLIEGLPTYIDARNAIIEEMQATYKSLGGSAIGTEPYNTNATKLFEDLQKDNVLLERVRSRLNKTTNTTFAITREDEKGKITKFSQIVELEGGTQFTQFETNPSVGDMITKTIESGPLSVTDWQEYTTGPMKDQEKEKAITRSLDNLRLSYTKKAAQGDQASLESAAKIDMIMGRGVDAFNTLRDMGLPMMTGVNTRR